MCIRDSGSRTDSEKARAIYEWIVDNTARNPKTRGCGTGDIRAMLETGDLTGKCADLNALYVGLARAAGLPARDVYGIRVADSRFGYKSLGRSAAVSYTHLDVYKRQDQGNVTLAILGNDLLGAAFDLVSQFGEVRSRVRERDDVACGNTHDDLLS